MVQRRGALSIGELVRDRVAALDEPYRTIAIGRYYAQWPEDELGQAFGLSTRTVRFILDGALAQMTDLLVH